MTTTYKATAPVEDAGSIPITSSGSQLSITPAPGGWNPSSDLHCHSTYPPPTYTHTIWELREYFFLLDKLELLVLLVFIIHRHDHNQRSFYKSYIFSLVLQVTKLNFPTTSKSIISSFNWVEIPWTEYSV